MIKSEMIKSEFQQHYANCISLQAQDYELNSNVASPKIFNVDCVFEQARRRGRRCDEFVFFDLLSQNKTGVYLIELKTNSTKIDQIKEQLQGGANFIADFLNSGSYTPKQYDFLPVLVSKGIKPSHHRTLLRQTISLGTIQKLIQHVTRKKTLPPI